MKLFQDAVMEAGLRMKVRKVNMVVYTQSQRHCGLNLDDGNEKYSEVDRIQIFFKVYQGTLGWIGCGRRKERGIRAHGMSS